MLSIADIDNQQLHTFGRPDGDPVLSYVALHGMRDQEGQVCSRVCRQEGQAGGVVTVWKPASAVIFKFMQLSPDAQMLAGSTCGRFEVMDLISAAIVLQLGPDESALVPLKPRSAHWSPDSRFLLAFTTDAPSFGVWDAVSWREVARVHVGAGARLGNVQWNPYCCSAVINACDAAGEIFVQVGRFA